MGGKTTSWKCLEHALNNTNNPVDVHVLNPKSVSILELYGEFNAATSEWKDGIISHLIRDCWFNNSSKPTWIITDGPVDAVWIESMNSLLDDNKILCLPNNERIQLNPTTKMVFETDDLTQASPATVSRCGMIYYDPSNLTWKSIIEGWCLRNNQFPNVTKLISTLADQYVPNFIQFLMNDAKLIINITPNIAINNFL